MSMWRRAEAGAQEIWEQATKISERKQGKSKHKQGLFECKRRILSEGIKKKISVKSAGPVRVRGSNWKTTLLNKDKKITLIKGNSAESFTDIGGDLKAIYVKEVTSWINTLCTKGSTYKGQSDQSVLPKPNFNDITMRRTQHPFSLGNHALCLPCGSSHGKPASLYPH